MSRMAELNQEAQQNAQQFNNDVMAQAEQIARPAAHKGWYICPYCCEVSIEAHLCCGEVHGRVMK